MTLQEIRRSKDMALGEAARTAGLTTVEVSRIERGRLQPTEEQLAAIAKALSISADEARAALPEPSDDILPDSLVALAAVASTLR